MSVLLHLLRHGEPELSGRMLGHTDSPATSAGVAACFAQASDLKVDRIVTSDLLRASACATPIASLMHLQVETDPRWRELDFGGWDGLSAADIDTEALGRFWEDPDANPPPAGESWSALRERVTAALADVQTGTTLIVTHGGAIRAALAALCGFDHRQLWAFDLPYAALISVRVWRVPVLTAQIIGLSQ